jgi:hypothetical protein
MSDEPSAGGSPSPKKPGKKAKLPEGKTDKAALPQGSTKAAPRRRRVDPEDSSGAVAAAAIPHVPEFARSYPRDPELDVLVETFEAGNYARVREGAQRLAESAERDEVRRAARDLRKRVDPDPLMIYLLLAAIALLAALAVHYWTHQNGSP